MQLEKFLKSKGLSVLPISGTSEIRLQCPNCRAQGNTYKDHKLYFNTVRKVWQCKRCEEVGGLSKLLKLLKITRLVSSAPTLKELKRELRGKRQSVQRTHESALPWSAVPAWSANRARQHLHERGFSKSSAERHGFLYCPRGYFRKRLLLPVFDERGRYRTFAARYLGNNSRIREEKKYIYPKHFAVSRLLGYLHTNKAAKRGRFCILTEGLFDAIHCSPYGVCTFGTNLSDFQVRLLREARIKRIVICWDNDTKKVARQNVRAAIKRARKKLRKHFDVVVLWLPKRGTDPVDYKPKKLFKWCDKLFQEAI
jgi:hypothetical protein